MSGKGEWEGKGWVGGERVGGKGEGKGWVGGERVGGRGKGGWKG